MTDHTSRQPWRLIGPTNTRQGRTWAINGSCTIDGFSGDHDCRLAEAFSVEAAHLMTAAPDLLEALCFAASVIKSQGLYDLSERMAVEQAEAAIAKATGTA